VVPGDSLYSIGKQYGVNYFKIARENELDLNKTLVVGQTIVIKEAGTTKKLGNIDVNGYAFPAISDELLNKAIPYLTYLSIFSYAVRADGSLVGINEQELINKAKNSGVQPVMVITNTKEGEGFDTSLAHTILNSTTAQDNLIKNVLATMKSKGYEGLDVDFEYVDPQDKDEYNAFMRKLSVAVKNAGYFLTVALAPKTSATQKGTLYEAHDYRFQGSVVDHVILMTYEWGYTYSAPMAVAPLPAVKRVLDYAVSEIPAGKILMGIPNYGYNWKTPYKEGTAAQSIGNYQAVDIARKYYAKIDYDYVSQSPYFNYYDEGQGHQVWFEDARSIEAKLKIIPSYGLSGISYWTLNRKFPQNWLVLSSLYNINKKA